MLRRLLKPLMIFLAATTCISAQAQNYFWQDVPETEFSTMQDQVRTIVPNNYRTLKLDVNALLAALQAAPMEFTEAARSNAVILSLPLPGGGMQRFSIVQSPLLEPSLQAKYPEIRTWSGQGIDDGTATIKLDWTYYGFHAQVLSALAEPFYIDPYARGEVTQYIAYNKSDLAKKNIESSCLVVSEGIEIAAKTQAGFCFGMQLRTYRLALAATGEYSVAVAGSNPTKPNVLSAMTTTVNRVNGVYEKEVAIRLTMVNNENIIYLDGTTDPYTNSSGNTMLGENQNTIDVIIGSANYDIGHVFSTGGGGIAGLGVVCRSSLKARGVTGSPSPTGDAYDIDYVAHEMGHQFGGNHTFNATTGNCGGGARNAGSAVEPGSGITIMAYAGICLATNNLSDHSIPYFHTTSQGEIGNYSQNSLGNGCAALTNTGNMIPVVNAGPDYTIPASTPFMLTGSATDPNPNDVLTYSWEEYDVASFSGDWNNGGKPFFRSFPPTLSPTRYFPRLSDVINNTTTIGEFKPTSSQQLNFRLTARDNRNGGGGVCSDEMIVNVSTASAAFTVSSQPSVTNWTANGSNTTAITWTPGSTASAPFNAANVSILFSADGGLTWPHTLVASTPNDGNETIIIPSIPTTKGRIMVKAVGNIFFNVNLGNITVTSACTAEGAIVTPANDVTAFVGNSSLNLNLSPQFSTPFAPAGTLTTSDPSSNLAVINSTTSGCSQFINQMRHDVFPFIVTQSGSYTFSLTAPFPTIMNLYLGSFDPANPCANFITSNGSTSGTGITVGTSFNRTLAPNNVYVLVIGTFNSTQPALPANYSVNVTPPAGGNAYAGTGIFVNPGTSFNYAYVVVNNATGNIVSISGTSNLTNSALYPAGSYTVYGFSYFGSLNPGTFVGGSFTAFTTHIANNPGPFCANLSKNAVTVIITSPFPVTYLDFTGRKAENKVVLDWSTASEQNSSHFIVQRSANGAEFTTEVGKVQAAGNSSTVKNYTLTDAAPLTGWNYYRLKQVDLDGKFSYSNIVAVNFDRPASTMNLYPNPVKDQLNLSYNSTRTGKLEIQVVDSKGSVLMKFNTPVTTGANLETINVGSLPQGVYILRYLEPGGNVSNVKFIKQ